MRSKYVVSSHTLEIAIFALQPLMGPFFSSLSTPLKYFPANYLFIILLEMQPYTCLEEHRFISST